MSGSFELKSIAMMKVLFNRYCGSNTELMSFLPEEDRTALDAIDITSDDIAALSLFSQETLFSLHYSWLALALKDIPEELHTHFFSVLTDSQVQGLSSFVKDNVARRRLPNKIKAFFVDYFFSFFDSDNVIVRQWLPPSELMPLLDCDKHALVTIINLLGLYDLVKEMPKVLDRDQLGKIYRMLTTRQKHYLKKCARDQGKISLPPINLHRWDGDCAKLKNILHRRGLIRLALAVSDESPAFMWHLYHHFDTGRASILKKNITTSSNKEAVSVSKKHVNDILLFLRA